MGARLPPIGIGHVQATTASCFEGERKDRTVLFRGEDRGGGVVLQALKGVVPAGNCPGKAILPPKTPPLSVAISGAARWTGGDDEHEITPGRATE